MNIRVRKYESGDMDDPNVGAPIENNAAFQLLVGRSVSGLGGVSADTERVVVNFSDGTAIWFVTSANVPRILIQKYPK